jgi:hypothetical protein
MIRHRARSRSGNSRVAVHEERVSISRGWETPWVRNLALTSAAGGRHAQMLCSWYSHWTCSIWDAVENDVVEVKRAVWLWVTALGKCFLGPRILLL